MTSANGMTGFSMGNGTASASEALRHFAFAFAFLIFGLFALFLNSGLVSEGGFRDLKVIAGIHFLTLGWLSLSIFGALQVFSGVALGGSSLNHWMAGQARWIWSGGILFFVFGFLLELPTLSVGGFLLLGVALSLYTATIIPVLLAAKRGQITRAFVSIAFISLWCAWLLGTCAGLARIGKMPTWLILPPGYFSAHLLFAIFGWVGSMVIGVGSHLVPMFALSRDNSSLPLKIALGLWILLPIIGVISAFYPQPWSTVGWWIAAMGSLAWCVQFLFYLRARIRREKDHGIRIAAFATAFLLLAWISGAVVTDPVPFIALAVVGWLCLFTLGIYHRVIPFLVWFVRFSQAAKGTPPPKIKDLIDQRIAFSVEILVTAGIVIWILGLWQHTASITYAGSGLICLGAFCSLLQLKTLFGSTRKEMSLHGTLRRNP